MRARVVFNHLLVRMLYLASERFRLLLEQRDNIHRWATDTDHRSQYTKNVRNNVDELLKNHDCVVEVIRGLDESKPKKLSAEQQKIARTIRKMYKWSVSEFQAVYELAHEVKFDKAVFSDLEKGQMEQPNIEKD